MFEQFLLKYWSADGKIRHTPVDENNDVFKLAGIKLGGSFVFNESNIVTVSGVNSLTDKVTEVSGASSIGDDILHALILSVSGASSLRDDAQDLASASDYSTLNALALSISGASSLRDDSQDLLLQSVSGTLNAKILSVSGASSLRDDSQDSTLISVSASLQSQINSITSDIAKEERFAASGGQTVFDLTNFTFDPSESIRDIQVFKNGLKTYQSLDGTLPGTVSGGDYIKNSDSQIEFLYPLQDGDRVIVRDERTGGGGGGSTDLENIIVNPQPLTNGFKSLGTDIKAWAGIYVKDTMNTNIYVIEVSGGVLQARLV